MEETFEQVTERHRGKALMDSPKREASEQVEKHLYRRQYRTADGNGQLCITEYLWIGRVSGENSRSVRL